MGKNMMQDLLLWHQVGTSLSMYTASRKYFNEVLEKVARDSAQLLQSLAGTEKLVFLSDLSVKQLKRILLLVSEAGDRESCNIITELIQARGYHNEL